MRRTFAILGVFLQVALLAYMAADREWLIHRGRTLYLRTMPVDPRDPFRGDYVRLDYEISWLDSRLWRDGLKAAPSPEDVQRPDRGKGRQVFLGLSVDESGVAEPEYVTDRRPAEGLFLKGRTDSTWANALQVHYGLEAYFMEQGKGLDLERGRTRPDRIRIPLEMETAVGSSGASVLKGHRWCALGIGLEIETERDEAVRGMRPRAAKLSLYNASDRPLSMVDLPGGRSFSLEPDNRWSSGGPLWRWVGEDAPRQAAVRDEDVRSLPPGGAHTVIIPFSDPAWFVTRDGVAARSLSEQGRDWSVRFRFVYRPPGQGECAGLKNADQVWHGRLLSSAFSGGSVD